MPRFHNINGVRVQFTVEEETARDVEEQRRTDKDAAIVARQPLTDWEKAIAATDIQMPRWFEDTVTDGSVILKPGLVKDNYDSKVALRGEKP